MNKKTIVGLISLLVFTSAASGTVFGYFISQYSLKENIKPISASTPTRLNTPAPTNTNLIADVAQETMPWVVNIHIEKSASFNTEDFSLPFGQFFDDRELLKRRKMIGGGSGIIVRKDGYILTNGHVINGADIIKVNLADGRTYNAKIIGTDETTDLAVLKINSSGSLPEAKQGNSSGIRIGEWVIAVGSPLGFEQSVTQGIISAKNRRVRDIPTSVDFIQTDAAINPGNSGGPLINLKGETIGINTAIRADAQNIGFAIPVNTAKKVASQIIDTGKVERPWIGIEMRELRTFDDSVADNESNRVFINRIMPDSPASKAGLLQGDIITGVNGFSIKDGRDVQRIVTDNTIGISIKFDIIRNSIPKTINVKTEPSPYTQR